MRKRFLKLQKGIRGPGDVFSFLRGFKLSYLAPETPAIAEFSTGEVRYRNVLWRGMACTMDDGAMTASAAGAC